MQLSDVVAVGASIKDALDQQKAVSVMVTWAESERGPWLKWTGKHFLDHGDLLVDYGADAAAAVF